MKKHPITFNPGPSQLSPKMLEAIHEITVSGFLSQSHRGSKFKEVCRQAIEGLRKQMKIPEDYQIFFQPSATTAMDTLLRNLVFKNSFHFVNGSFAERFYETALELKLDSKALQTPWNQSVSWKEAVISEEVELIGITHNETSTGSMWPTEDLKALRQKYSKSLMAIDVASSFGALATDWTLGDVWFGSVQKCVGLPAGLGFMFVNQRAIEKSQIVLAQKGNVASWQRFDHLLKQILSFQTFETPNMLAIGLLAKQMEDWDILAIEQELYRKKKLIYETGLDWEPYIVDPNWQSPTVANFIVGDAKRWHEIAKNGHYVLGQGYGKLKDSCIRIANFPALSYTETYSLIEHLKKT